MKITNKSEGDSRSDSLKIEHKFLTTDEAAKVLGLTCKALRNITSNGKVPYYKLGRRNRYRLDDLVALVLANKRGIGADND